MWKTLLACCLPCLRSRHKKNLPISPEECSPHLMSPSPLSPNRVSEVLKEDMLDVNEEQRNAVETDNLMTTSLTEEETTDPGVTAISPPSQTFETEPDQLFDYTLNQVPPELSGLQTSDFLKDPDEMNIAFLPKHVLVRIVEMLSPKDFGALAQTCRFLHWRLMKWGCCSVKELTVEVRQNGTRRNGDPRIGMSPRMAYNVFRKHIQFDHINLIIVVPATGASAPLFKKMASVFRSRDNIKYLEMTAIRTPPMVICATGEDLCSEGNMLRDVHAGRVANFSVPLLEELGTLEAYSHHFSTGRLLQQHLTYEGPPRTVTHPPERRAPPIP